MTGLDRRAFLGLAGAAVLTGCTGTAEPRRASGPGPTTVVTPSPTPYSPPPAAPYSQDVADAFYDLKTRAGRFAQQLATYDVDAGPVPLSLPPRQRARTLAALAPLRRPGVWSRAQVRLVQLGGLVPVSETATYASCMVVLEQELTSPDRSVSTVTRTVDVRLRRPGREWVVEELSSAGGLPLARPDDLPAVAQRVLDSPRITLADSARWDIHAGVVDRALLQVMGDLADDFAYSVVVLRNGHPPNVIDGRTKPPVSNHWKGRAVDVYAIDGTPVERLAPDRLTAFLRAIPALGGRREVGTPPGFDLDGQRGDFFANTVHVDHVHVAVEPGARAG